MAYQKQNFIDGEVLTAEKLNHMENGIAESYIKPSGGISTGDIANGAITQDKLAANAVSQYYTATIGTGWSGDVAPYSITVSVNGILSSDNPIIDLSPSVTFSVAESQIEAFTYIYRAIPTANAITFYATDKPTVSIPIKIMCVRK